MLSALRPHGSCRSFPTAIQNLGSHNVSFLVCSYRVFLCRNFSFKKPCCLPTARGDKCRYQIIHSRVCYTLEDGKGVEPSSNHVELWIKQRIVRPSRRLVLIKYKKTDLAALSLLGRPCGLPTVSFALTGFLGLPAVPAYSPLSIGGFRLTILPLKVTDMSKVSLLM